MCIYLFKPKSLSFKAYVIFICVYVHLCVYISVWICTCDTGTCKGQKVALDLQELELPALWATAVSAGNWTQIFHKRGTTEPSLLALKLNLYQY